MKVAVYVLLFVNAIHLYNIAYKNLNFQDTSLVQQFSKSISMHLSHDLDSWL